MPAKTKDPKVRMYNARIERVKEAPPGFVTNKTFCSRVGVTTMVVSRAKDNGEFKIQNLRWKQNKSGSDTLLIHWENEGPRFARDRDRDITIEVPVPPDAPQGTEPNKIKVPPPPSVGIGTTISGDPEGTYGQDQTLRAVQIKKVQLQNEKQELELKKARNEVVEFEPIRQVVLEMGQSIKQSVLAMVPRLAPVLAAETEPHSIARILEEEFYRTLEAINMSSQSVDKLGPKKDKGDT